jgi:hypothetical protein
MNNKEKIQAAVLDMATKIERDSKHIYRNPLTGDMYQGVSTVSSIIPKDWLAAWGAKETVKFLGFNEFNDFSVASDIRMKMASLDAKGYQELLKEAKGAAFRKSKQALLDGKAGHAWLETYIQAKIDGKPLPIVPIGLLERPLRQWLEWEERTIQEWVASESLVVRPDKSYAGQLDAIAILKNGFTAMIDFKFASHISEDYYLQTAGYSATFEPYGILFDSRIIVRLPKTLEQEDWNPKTFKRTMVPNNIEIHEVPTKYETDRDAFFHALPLKGWINYVIKLTDNNKNKSSQSLKPFKKYPKEKSNPKAIPF